MIRTGLISGVVAMVLSQAAVAEEFARATLMGHDIVLNDDMTWAFVDPGMTLADSADGPWCLSSSDDRINVCPPPDLWLDREILVDASSEQHFYSRGEEAFSLMVVSERGFGHEGDFEGFAGLDDAEGGPVLTIINWLFDLPRYEITARRADDVIVTRSGYAEAADIYESTTIEIFLPSELVMIDFIDLGPVAGQDLAPPSGERAQMIEATLAGITIDGQPYETWLVAAEDIE
ncbi:hypothetical protein [Jannaschia marina]|uniref:hypothetical protein n=1 Tax=Jannaschia marina TaxID=2741674 RepID=UPI0015CB7FE7|nr:hypothetical protein [Jannaschia marina]